MSYFLTLTPQPPKTHPAKNINVPKNRSCRQTFLFTFQVSAIRMCIDWIRQLKEFSKTKVNNQKRWVKSRWFPTVVFPFHTTEINKKLTMQFVLKHCHLASYNLEEYCMSTGGNVRTRTLSGNEELKLIDHCILKNMNETCAAVGATGLG